MAIRLYLSVEHISASTCTGSLIVTIAASGPSFLTIQWSPIAKRAQDLSSQTAIHEFPVDESRLYSRFKDLVRRNCHDILGENDKVCTLSRGDRPECILREGSVSGVDGHTYQLQL